MSYCPNMTRNYRHIVSERYLKETAHKLRSTLQCWIATFLSTGWMPTQKIYDLAQEGGLLYPLGLVEVSVPGI